MRARIHTQIRSGMATQIAVASPKRKPLGGGPLEVAGREEKVHYRSLAWCHALCCIQWLQLAAASAVGAACIPPTLARVASCTLVLWIRACWCCSHCSCLVAAAGGGGGRCCAGAHNPLSSGSGQRHPGCCPLLLPLLCASLCTVAVSLCSYSCCCGAVLCVWWREGGEGTEGERGDQHNLSNNKAMQTKKSAPKRERGKKAVPKWKATRK